jgi:isopropylmalate/homocitrate/citramalate synthase
MIVYNYPKCFAVIVNQDAKERKATMKQDNNMFQNRPVTMNEKNNLLQIEEHMYILDDVEKPNVFRNMFPYEEIPRIPFNDRIVPHNMPKDIWITDTTFRDGQQSRAPYTTEQIVRIYDMLHELGGENGMIRASEFFLYSKKDRDAVYRCLEKGYKFPEVTSWIRASQEDFKLVKEIGLKETGILVSCSDYHIFLKLKMTRRQAMEHYLSVIRSCLDEGISPRCHLEDITRADIYGFVVPFCIELMKLMEEYQIPIKVRACDTMGYGVNFSGAVIPRSVQGIIYALNTNGGVPSELMEWHGHNDFYKAVTNSTTAWLYGCSGVNCSLFGIGERTGNTPLEAMVFEYAQLKGTLNGMNTQVITDLAEYYEKEIGFTVPPQTPFVGKNFNVTRAGIHADGLLKNEEIYNIFDTDKFLRRPPVSAVSNTSGLAGIAHWINVHFHLKGDDMMDKKSPLVTTVKKWVDTQYADGRVTVLTDEELLGEIENAGRELGIHIVDGNASGDIVTEKSGLEE